MKRCDRCGANVVDVVGSRQASPFDVVPADRRATDAARAELRAGRVLCSACQRTDDLPGMREADAALTIDAVGSTFDLDDVTIRTTLEPFPVNGSPRMLKMPCGHYETIAWRGTPTGRAASECRACRAGQSDRTNALCAATAAKE